MTLLQEVSKLFLQHVFSPPNRPKRWRALVVDDESKMLLSSCLRMQDVMDTGITLVENIARKRKILPLEAIYVLYPNMNTVNFLIKDFSTIQPQYTAAYVYFTIACSKDILKLISSSGCLKYLKALSQLNVGFLPRESHTFSISSLDTAQLYTCPVDRIHDRNARLDRLAEQLATVCVMLNEYPKIRYKMKADNLELARLLQMKLDQHRSDTPLLGQGLHKDRSVLLLLDRGFDPLTPFMHDLTLQALIRDIANIEDNIFKYSSGQEFELNDSSKLWSDLRHEHIADVSRKLPDLVRQFAESKRHFLSSQKKTNNIDLKSSRSSSGDTSFLTENGKPDDINLRALQTMVRELPQYQREAAVYNGLAAIADLCLSECKKSINKICALEQDLAMGQTAEGDLLQDPMRSFVEVLSPDTMSEVVRFRLLVIYIISRGGISETNLDKLLNYAKLSLTYKSMIAALSSVIGARLVNSAGSTFDSPLLKGLPDLSSSPSWKQYYLPSKGKRIAKIEDNCYALSRWTPYLEDLLEKCISDKLDSHHFPFLLGANSSSNFLQSPDVDSTGGPGPSARFRAPSPKPSSEHQRTSSVTSNITVDDLRPTCHCGPRLIVFIVGGVTWSETRLGYMINQKCVESRLRISDQTQIRSKEKSSGILKDGGGTGWNWEVFIGGTGILTADTFFRDLKYLSDYI